MAVNIKKLIVFIIVFLNYEETSNFIAFNWRSKLLSMVRICLNFHKNDDKYNSLLNKCDQSANFKDKQYFCLNFKFSLVLLIYMYIYKPPFEFLSLNCQITI